MPSINSRRYGRVPSARGKWRRARPIAGIADLPVRRQNRAMGFSIRTACQGDIAAMHRLRCSVRENRLSDPGSVTERAYRPYVDAGSAWLAESGGRLLGFAALDLRSSSLWALFVAPEAEGRGIGRALHRHMLEQARKRGAGSLWLSTSPGTRAERFYKSAGWRTAEPTPEGELRLRIALET
jgi:GNAT superfamily N-acetyltransferase